MTWIFGFHGQTRAGLRPSWSVTCSFHTDTESENHIFCKPGFRIRICLNNSKFNQSNIGILTNSIKSAPKLDLLTMHIKLIIQWWVEMLNIFGSKKVNSGYLWGARLRGQREGSRQLLFCTLYFQYILSFPWHVVLLLIYFNWKINSKKLRTLSAPFQNKPQISMSLSHLFNTVNARILRRDHL